LKEQFSEFAPKYGDCIVKFNGSAANRDVFFYHGIIFAAHGRTLTNTRQNGRFHIIFAQPHFVIALLGLC